MDSVLGRKQRIKNSDWIETFDKIEQLITKEELDQLVNKTIQDIKAKTKGKQAAYAWSGGKDLPSGRNKLLRPRNQQFGV